MVWAYRASLFSLLSFPFLDFTVGHFITHSTLSTPFIYYPRTAPARGIPPRLEPRTCIPGLHITPEWRVHESHIASRLPGSSKGIICKVRLPSSSFPTAQFAYVRRHASEKKKGLYPCITRPVYAPPDPVPRHLYGTPSRPGNAPHLYAIAIGCGGCPRVFTGSAPTAN